MGENTDVTDWRPSASQQLLQLRARILYHIRQFFADRQVMEVETPLLCTATNPDPNIESFTTTYKGPQAAQGISLYLQSSPEFAMKRLLSAGSGPIYQISKAFRQGEWGALHNPEFTILEWYRPGFALLELISEIETLMQQLFSLTDSHLAPTEIVSYQQVFANILGIDPLQVRTRELMDCAARQGLSVQGLQEQDRDAWLDLLMSHIIQPQLGRNCMTFVTGYPVSQAALARIDPNDKRVAERFELFINGLELANGFHELSDVSEQKRRFQLDLANRQARNQLQPPIDKYLLRALQQGLPDCCGVAVGVDRVVMTVAGLDSIKEVLAFPLDRI